MSGIDSAAAAFQASMNGTSVGDDEETSGVEDIFPHLSEGPDDENDGAERRTRSKRSVPDADEGDDGDGEGDEDPGEGEGSEDEEGEGDADDADDADDDANGADDQLFAVLVDGEEVEVPLKEALEGYIRTQTFHRRLSKVEEYKKEVEAVAAEVIQNRQKTVESLTRAQKMLELLIPVEPDWDKLYAEDPANARSIQKQFDAYKAQVSSIGAEREKALKEQQEADAKATAAYAASERNKFVAANPNWATRQDMDKDLSSMRRTALATGFSQEEIDTVYDHRMLVLLQKASKYDRMMASRPRPVNKGTKPVKPGAGNKGTASRSFRDAQKTLSRTGSVEDAAAVFSKILR